MALVKLNPILDMAQAIELYADMGFEYIEVPYAVDPFFHTLTAGEELGMKVQTPVGEKILVGSAEQGFLELATQGKLKEGGRYMSVTPCFRMDEPDSIHKWHFLKLELFVPLPKIPYSRLRNCAEGVMVALSGYKPQVVPVDSHSSDLYINNLEVGSYGYREAGGLNWVYGTGLALPRFYQAINPYRNISYDT